MGTCEWPVELRERPGYLSSSFLARRRPSRPKPAGRLPGPLAAPGAPSGDGSLLRSGMARRRAGFEFSASRLAARSSGEFGSPPAPTRPGCALACAVAVTRARGGGWLAAGLARGRVAAGPPALGLLLRLLLGALADRAAHARDGRHAGHPAAAHHLPHHLLAFEEPDDEVVDLADGDPGPVGDAGPAGPVEDLRVAPLGRGHRVDDGRRPVQVLVVDLVEQLTVLPPRRAACRAGCRSARACAPWPAARRSPRG